MAKTIRMRPKDQAPWFEIKNAAEGDGPAQVFIYEEIDDWWGLSAKDFVQQLAALDVDAIDLHINSPGGSVFDGHAIFNALRNHKATVTTYIDGLAASIASEIALAGDKVIIAENGTMMIHDPYGMCVGGSGDMRKMADVLDKLRDTIAMAYVAKTGKDADEINAAMAEETWLVGQEAVDFGLADEVGAEMKAAACAQFDFKALGFKHPPAAIAEVGDSADGGDDDADGDEPEAPVAVVADPPDTDGAPGAGDTAPTMDAVKVAQALRARFEEA